MNSLLDDSLVGLALLVSLGYAVASMGPRTWRRRLPAALSRLLALAPAIPGLRAVARKLSAASMIKPRDAAAGACGGCDNCAPEQAAGSPSASLEVKVPVANIGRREIETSAGATRR